MSQRKSRVGTQKVADSVVRKVRAISDELAQDPNVRPILHGGVLSFSKTVDVLANYWNRRHARRKAS